MIYSKKLSQFKNLIHGFTTRKEGDFRKIREFKQDLFLPEQVHEDKIAIVNEETKSRVINGADGLVTREKEIVLGITTADCLPILFYEPKKKIIAVCHAGWKGSLKRISQRIVQKIRGLGGEAARIMVVIGPHIKKCCYHIDKKRANRFKKEFGSQVISQKNGKLFLDLTRANLLQFLESGITKSNIEVLPFCTGCDGQFFSYRREKENYGEMLSFIRIKDD